MKLGKADKAIFSTPVRAVFTIFSCAILGLLILFGAAIWAKPELIRGRDLKWQEEVVLPDGRVLLLSRYQEFNGPATPFQPPTESDYWLEFVHPETGKKVRFEGNRFLQTIFLAVDKGTPYLLLEPQYTGFERLRCPDPPYQLFRYQNERWEWISLDEIPIRKFRLNVTRTPEKWRSQLEGWKAKLGLTFAQDTITGKDKLTDILRYTVDLSNAPNQKLYDGRPFIYRDPSKVEETVTDPRDLACLSVEPRKYLENPDQKVSLLKLRSIHES